jgi:hypothetical protein
MLFFYNLIFIKGTSSIKYCSTNAFNFKKLKVQVSLSSLQAFVFFGTVIFVKKRLMPKPKYLLSEYTKKEIFKKLCIQVGFPIFTKLDCKKVSELITKSGFSGISESTIYRLFLWKGNKNMPYLHTLNTLAEFCGYESWNDFDIQQQEIALKKYVALPFHFDYFIEWYVADEQIYYLKLLEKYKEAHHENPEKLIFYYSISAIISFKKQKFDKLSSYSEQLNTLKNQCVPNNILKARIIGVHYLNDLKNGNLNADNKIIAIDFETLFPDIGDRVTSVFFLFNYLFEAKAFDLMIKLFERFLSHEVVFFSIWTRINWNQLCVFMAQAYLENKQENQAKSYFIQIQPSLFEIFNKNYFHRIYDKLSLSF